MNFRPSLLSRIFEGTVLFGIACLIIRTGINYLWPVRWIIIFTLAAVIGIPIVWRLGKRLRQWYDWRHRNDWWW